MDKAQQLVYEFWSYGRFSTEESLKLRCLLFSGKGGGGLDGLGDFGVSFFWVLSEKLM